MPASDAQETRQMTIHEFDSCGTLAIDKCQDRPQPS